MGQKHSLPIEVARTMLQIYKNKWAKYFEKQESYKYIPILPRQTWQEKNGVSVCLVNAIACPPSCRSNTCVCCDMTQMGYAFCTNVVWHERDNFLGSSGLGNCPVFPLLSACNPLFPFLHPFHSHKAFFTSEWSSSAVVNWSQSKLEVQNLDPI